MKILLTGSSGFLGSECLRQLEAADHEVVTTDRHGKAAVGGDLADAAFCAGLPEVDTVVHCAAVQYVTERLPLLARRTFFQRNNAVATSNLVARYGGRAHFVNVGTSMMYAQTGRAVYSTDAPRAGQGVYSESKLAAQRAVESAGGAWALVIPCIIGGPGREGLFRSFVATMTRARLALIPGAGRHPIHMVHVADLAALITTLVAQRATGRFNAAAPGPLSIVDWVSEIEQELGLSGVRRLHLPLAPIAALARISGYRLLAREQLLMLKYPHVLDVSESEHTGWRAQHSCSAIVRATAAALVAQARR